MAGPFGRLVDFRAEGHDWPRQVVPDRESIGWRGAFSCGWRGEMSERVTSPAAADLTQG